MTQIVWTNSPQHDWVILLLKDPDALQLVILWYCHASCFSGRLLLPLRGRLIHRVVFYFLKMDKNPISISFELK